MKVRIKWVEGVSFLAQTESSHGILMDGSAEGGGRNLGPRPMETVLAGTGGTVLAMPGTGSLPPPTGSIAPTAS